MSTDITLTRIIAARAALILDQPFFGVLALQLAIVIDATCKTAWTDGRSLGFNPAFVATLTAEQLIAVICHEVLHCACGHPWRRNGRDFQQWNEACDFAINPIVKDAGMQLPADCLFNPEYAGRHAEWIFDRIGKGDEEGPQGKPQGPQGNDQPGDEQGSSNDPSDSTGDDSGGSEGSDAPGDPQGEVRDAPADTPGDEDGLTESDWKEIEGQARKLAKGSLSAGAQRGLEQQAKPIVDWRAALRRFMQTVSAADYSWVRPNPRHAVRGLYLPSLRTEAMGAIVVAVDTSGSIDDVLLAQFAGELSLIAEDLKPERIHVVYCDSEVCGQAEYAAGEHIDLTPCGGGGTDFSPVFDWVEAEGLQPVALVYFTDLMGSFPDVAPAYPVLWAQTGGYDLPVPFGDIIPID